jgi:hypothetical protein
VAVPAGGGSGASAGKRGLPDAVVSGVHQEAGTNCRCPVRQLHRPPPLIAEAVPPDDGDRPTDQRVAGAHADYSTERLRSLRLSTRTNLR